MKKILKLHFGIGAVAAILFAAIATFVAVTMRSMMVEEAHKTIAGAVQAAASDIDTLIASVESAVNNSAWIVKDRLNDPENAVRVSHAMVADNPIIVGSTVAFVPNYYPNRGLAFAPGRLYAPYTYRNEKGEITDDALRYDYLADAVQSAWFAEPRRLNQSYWCEPYFDEGASYIMMCTYSVPIADKTGAVVAIFTADVSLAELTAHVAKMKPYSNSYIALHSKRGKTVVAPPAGVEERANDVTVSDETSNGWTLEMVCPIRTVLEGARRVVLYVSVFSLLGLATILTVSWVLTNRLQRQAADHQRIESELAIANVIQSSMIRVKFPDWAAGRMRPAKEVGGDRYDFAEQDGVAWFGIGDASGKGVPAALYTSLVGAGFRMGVQAGLDLSALIGAVNRIIAENNDTGMFVTALVGRLDRANGRLDVCNAGHNPPVIIAPDGTVAPHELIRNLVMGAIEDFAYKAQSVDIAPGSKIVLYTDGVTEAMNAANEQYGMERLLAFAAKHAKDAPDAFADALMASVAAFAGDAPQSDDITVLVVSC